MVLQETGHAGVSPKLSAYHLCETITPFEYVVGGPGSQESCNTLTCDSSPSLARRSERLRSAIFVRLAMEAKGRKPIVKILAMIAGHAMVHRSSCLSLHALAAMPCRARQTYLVPSQMDCCFKCCDCDTTIPLSRPARE